jgi:Protein of unknown function (DUF2961)
VFGDPSLIDLTQQPRAITFENPTGARGAGGAAGNGRKGAPSRTITAGERVTLADIEGPGTIRHIWCTFPPERPERMRALVLEIFYDDAVDPSISVPLLDFFAVTCGRPRPFTSALTSAQEGRGFNAYYPMPFDRRVRIELVNGSPKPVMFYFQIDYTVGPIERFAGRLHVTFRRENPTTLGKDFTIVDDLRGPGRFLGCAIGIRTIDAARWYGEGEVKIYLDGDTLHPTICGTGLEDYVGSAWGMGPHHALYGGAPLDVRAPGSATRMTALPAFVGFYRWHLPDPVVFADRLRVTIQQIGMNLFLEGHEDERDAYVGTNPIAGNGWFEPKPPGVAGMALFERVDDYSAAAFVYCRDVQPVPPVDIVDATSDLERHDHETSDPMESFLP